MGCDSIVTLKLFVKPTKTYNRGNVNLCQDSTYLFNNRYIGTSGTHIDTLETYLGCDSIVRVSITLRPNLNTTENRSICEGGYYVWTYSGYQRNQAGTLSPITQRDTLRQSGTYTKSNLLSNYGCGNSATINLVVNPTYNDTIYDTICYRPTYSGHGFYISNIQNTQHTETRTNSRQSILGCDSIVTLKLFVKPTKTYNQGNVNLCQDSTYLFNNRYIGTSGTHIDTLETYLGCDSIVRVSITLRPNLNTTENRSICEGGYYVWTYSGYQRNQAGTLSPITQRDTLRQSGTYTKSNLLSNYGCGNSATINLVVNPTYNDTIYDTICYRPTYSGHGFYISNIQNTQHTETRTNSR